MKSSTLLKFLEFPCCEDYVVSRDENGFKLDFSKSNALENNYSTNESNSKSQGVISIILLFILFLFSNFLTAQTITVDGNPVDWNAANFNLFTVKSYQLDPYGTGVVDTQFTSSKDFFLAGGGGQGHLGWVLGQTKAKNDIANAAAIVSNGILYFAGDRTSNNGDAQIGFWFLLNGTAPVAGGNFEPPHAVGDLLILADFTGGGANAAVTIYRWVGGGPLSSGSSYVVGSNNNLETTNLVGTVAENNASTYPIPTGWSFINPNYLTNEFYEGQVDLTSLNLANTCFSSFILEARSSQSITASLDDFVGGAFNVRPTVAINNVTVCSGKPAVFTATATGGIAPLTYSFNGGPFGASNTYTIDPATANGSVTVVVQGGPPNNCQSPTATGTLTISPAPTLVTHDPAPVCAPLTVNLTLAAVTAGSNLQGGTLTYWTDSGATTPLANPAAVSASGTYYIKATTSAGCFDIKPVTVTVIPSIPIEIHCSANVSTSACAYVDQAALDAAFATWVAGFTATGGNGTLITSGLNGLVAPTLCTGGSVTVNFSASDSCGKQAACSGTFTITAAPAVVVNQPANSTTSACAYANQAAVDAAFAQWL
ncbi:hypothetical protein, partial [Flavobacterium sp.]